MNQFGYNAGPRHKRVFSHAKSFKSSVDLGNLEGHRLNLECLGAFSLVWNLFVVRMPLEVVNLTTQELELASLPDISTPDIPTG